MDKVECLICGKYYKSLTAHLRIHHITAEEYKKEYGGPVVSEQTTSKLKKAANNRTEEVKIKYSLAIKEYWKTVTAEQRKERVNKKIKTEISKYGKCPSKGREPGFKHTDEFKKFMSEFMTENNPFKGCKHSKETKEKMSGPREQIMGDNNPFKKKYDEDEVFRNSFKEKHLDLWKRRDVEWRKRFSEKLSKSMAKSEKFQQNIRKHHINHHWLSDKCENGGYLRSSWEIYICDFMDSCDVIKKYEIEPISIKYYDQEKELYRYTKIDLRVYFASGETCLIEIKPSGLISNCEQKIKGVEEYCLENLLQFTVITENCIHNDEKTEKLFMRLNDGKCYLGRSVQQGFETPLCVNSQVAQREIVN